MKNLFKKFHILGILLIIISSMFTILSAPYTYADDSDFTGRTGSDCIGPLGLTSWDCDVTITDENSLKSGIWKIAANILQDIVIIAAYLVIGYVIYGGYLYVFSGGDPNKVATGKKALYHAFLGLAIVMSANIIMTAIRVALVGSSGNMGNCLDAPDACVDSYSMITNAIHWTTGIAGAVSVIFVVYGGISYTTSAGDPSKIQKAKSMIIYALIGLAIVALAEVITGFVSSMIRNAAYTNQTIISKEDNEIKIN